MRDDEVMFNWGVRLFVAAWVLVAALQVSNRVQDRARARTKAEIVRAQQDYADSAARFSSLMRPETLRGVVMTMYPNFQPIGFRKTVLIEEIPLNN
ncbi:MAG: hypothetical protein FWF34_01655 [Alphaproteobacteria bacterium]|nr:hypothetical protein [Alphaproteobacteria bacterium]MCL2889943.1 hypothetical protein [Alphaproteobacteria bacterium]